MIPKIVHFVYGFQEQGIEFEFYKYMAVKTASMYIKPDIIYFWCKHTPFGEYWEKTSLLVKLKYIDPPVFIFGNPVNHFAHQTDIIRLCVLRDYGGIYLDIDTICLKSFKNLMNNKFVIAKQDNLRYCNAIMLSIPNHPFIIKWYNSYKSFRSKGKDEYWDEHSCLLPRKILKEISYFEVTILKSEAFYPISFDKYTDIFSKKRSVLNMILRPGVYAMHLWETKSYDMLINDYENNEHTVLTHLYDNLPKTIQCYTTISTHNISAKMKSIIDSWNTYSLFESQSFTDMDCFSMIKDKASNRLVNAYLTLIPGAYRADIWRLFQLYCYGGLYRDSHIKCLDHTKLHTLCLKYDGVLVRDDITNKNDIYNAFMYFKNPRDPIISALLFAICDNISEKVYPYEINDKGCLCITGHGVHGKVIFDMGSFDSNSNILSFHDKKYYILTHEPIRKGRESEESVIRMIKTDLLRCRYSEYRKDIQSTYNGLKGYPDFFEKRLVYSKKITIDVVMVLRDVEAYCKFMKNMFSSFENLYPHIKLRFQIYESDSIDSTFANCQEFFEERSGNLYSEDMSMQKFHHEVSLTRGESMATVRNNLKRLHGELDSDFVLVMDSRIIFNPTCILSMTMSLQFDNTIGLISGYGHNEKSDGPYYDTLALIVNGRSYYGQIKFLEKFLLGLKHNKTIDCESCFGGMAMMPTWIYNKSKYWVDPSSPKDYSKNELPCEHHGFCKDVRNLNMRVVLNPMISFNKYRDNTSFEKYEEEFNKFI